MIMTNHEQSTEAGALMALGMSADNAKLYDRADVDRSLLERFESPMQALHARGCRGVVHIECPEFTSLCPITGQPDFATIVIDYRPAKWCVESKALKLYVGSFRNHRGFHEACVVEIFTALSDLLKPYYLKVEGRFTPRGGIPFWPTVEWGNNA